MPEVREAGSRDGVVREIVLMKTAAVLLALFVAACGPSEPLNVVGIQTGKSLNSDHSIGTHAATFHPNDPMYVSVLSNGRGKGTITVKWTFAGRDLQTLTKKVSYNGQAATDFRFVAADGFPVGDYTIEVTVDGKIIESRRVKVE